MTKLKKNILVHSEPILLIFGQKWIFHKILFLPVFFNSDLVSVCQISKKYNKKTPCNTDFRRTQGQTDGKAWI